MKRSNHICYTYMFYIKNKKIIFFPLGLFFSLLVCTNFFFSKIFWITKIFFPKIYLFLKNMILVETFIFQVQSEKEGHIDKEVEYADSKYILNIAPNITFQYNPSKYMVR